MGAKCNLCLDSGELVVRGKLITCPADECEVGAKMTLKYKVKLPPDVIHKIRTMADGTIRERTVCIYYTNWQGKTDWRAILPKYVIYTHNEWHHEPQWMWEAVDMEKEQHRTFPVANIHAWIAWKDADK